ncbi:carbamoyltransferase HypF [Thermosulfuriphilus sp.]
MGYPQEEMEALRILVSGVVQGVGFRPFVFRLAQRYAIKGWVLNTGVGVEIKAWGKNLPSFVAALKNEAPPLARIKAIRVEPLEGSPPEGFFVAKSQPGLRRTYIPADVATCEACLAEILNKDDRRYRYPFTNCTDCGPRYSVILDLPYDRAQTTMAPFELCSKCRQEYLDPANRRFHAEPNACPVCGPKVWVTEPDGRPVATEDPIRFIVARLSEGAIVALKGLGGFQLAVLAEDEGAVRRLRARKRRPAKPLAVMAKDLASVRNLAVICPEEERALLSPRRPIVLLKKRNPFPLAPSVAPGISIIGVMLPYTPLHYLLFEAPFCYLVMTSGNLSQEPIARTNKEAFECLADVADFFLLHDREIAVRVDDSVLRVMAGRPRLIRRARGYAPEPFELPASIPTTLAVGPFLKNTLAVSREGEVFVSQHIGDLEGPKGLSFFKETFQHLLKILDLTPEIVVSDLHPDYLSSIFAEEYSRQKGLKLLKVQHHLAHALSVLVEGDLRPPVLALVLDGLGLGDDGAIWGGELFWIGSREYRRLAHLEYLPLPGGEAAIRSPWRMALACLWRTFGEDLDDLPLAFTQYLPSKEKVLVLKMLKRGLNCPPTSSAGRLFEAVAAFLGLGNENLYEAQTALRLESVALSGQRPYSYLFKDSGDRRLISLRPAIREIVADCLKGVPVPVVAGRFVSTVIAALAEVAVFFSRQFQVIRILLSGGCFQNKLLLEGLLSQLESRGLIPYAPGEIPVNDGGISLGQVAYVSLFQRQNL